MTSFVFFAVSGVAIVSLISAKNLEHKKKKKLLILELISMGDTRIRELYHRLVGSYSDNKERVSFLFKRKIPMRSKYSLNKLTSFLAEKKRVYLNHMRNSKFLKKSDGMSEFFKNISNVEKGNGEINEVLEDDSQNGKKEVK